MTNRTHCLTLAALAEQLGVVDEALDDALSYLAGSPVERDGS